MADIQLRPTVIADLEQLHLIQQDKEGCQVAAFTPINHHDKNAFIEKFTKLLSNPTINMQTILVDGKIVGSVSKFEIENEAEITYWIDRAYWRKGIASKALEAFLQTESARPIYGRAAFDNIGSQKVLEKCGFVRIGTDSGFANARQAVIEEYIYCHS